MAEILEGPGFTGWNLPPELQADLSMKMGSHAGGFFDIYNPIPKWLFWVLK